MLKNFTISFKLKVNTFFIAAALLVIGFFTYSSLKTLQTNYSHSLLIAQESDTLNTLYINGLLYNSSSGVVFQNPNSKKAINTMKSALNGTKKAKQTLESINKQLFVKLQTQINGFISTIEPKYEKVIKNEKLSKEDMKSSLKAWRDLKFDIIKYLETSKKNSLKAQKNYDKTIENSIITLVGLIIFFFVFMLLFNSLLSRSIIQPLEKLNEAMMKLTSSSKDEKIQILSKDETAKIAHNFNIYIEKIEQHKKEDEAVINEVQKVVNLVNSGHLNTKVNVKTSNETIMTLVKSLNTMLNSLSNIFNHTTNILLEFEKQNFKAYASIKSNGQIQELLRSVNSLGKATSSMLVKNKSKGLSLQKSATTLQENVNILSKSSNSAAASLEETAAAVEQITSIIINNTNSIVEMAQNANNLKNSTNQGENLANKTTKAMEEINVQVNSINESIAVIDQIAFQTNILSLNAAVEAATAGEAGKGFAIVAQEVRNLANRSAQAAKQIKDLVENATQKANDGKYIANTMIEGYFEINSNVNKTLELINHIESSSKEQQAGISQINDAINSLDKQTQQNASIASQASDIALNTHEIANELVKEANDKEFFGKEDL